VDPNLMKALVARNGCVQVEERPLPKPGLGDVVVRTTAASICAADPAGVNGVFDAVSLTGTDETGAVSGIVLGHEGVGIVHAIGAGVSGFEAGDRVMSVATTPCGHCENCQRGVGGHCRDTMWGGYGYGFTRDGTLADFFTVPNASFNLAHIPDAVSDADALFVTDSFATGSSAIEGAQLPLGGTALVIGQGHIGLGATAAARAAGAGLVITVKSRPGGEKTAYAMGADVPLNLKDHDVRLEVSRLTRGRGVDLAVEASGATAAFELAVQVTRLGGQVSGVGTYTTANDKSLSIPLSDWGWGVGDKSIRTSYQRSGSERTDRLLRLIETHRIDSTPMFTHEYDFTNVLQALDDVRDGMPGLVKPFIRFS
jgi:isopropanol dehydrogenase (NADP+)